MTFKYQVSYSLVHFYTKFVCVCVWGGGGGGLEIGPGVHWQGPIFHPCQLIQNRASG